ncbi:MAG: chromosomal replication initiator protein DnaA [Eubacterium sp.]|nr:chromosomal replication initiator protein DnaA [Eubacterium sp.]
MHIIEEKWNEILQHIKTEHELSEVSFRTWLKPLQFHSIEDSVVTILVPTEQVGLDYVSKRYRLPFRVAIADITGLDCEIYFTLPEDVEKENSARQARRNSMDAGLNPRYTFDTFVVGSNNQFAHAAALAVAESPGKTYNPLFIYSGAGLGKTHLINSIAHFILQNHPDLKLLYVNSEQFTNEVIEAIRNGSSAMLSKLRSKYRNVDVLLIDDIQFVIGKESTQEEFFHTFNVLHDAGKQIVLTSDRPPKDMDILDERFRSRFEWGLMADIQSPDFETRMAILRRKQEEDGTHVDDKVLQYIAENIKSNIRELEGSLNKVIAKGRLDNRIIDTALAEEALSDIINPDKRRVVTPDFIIEVVAEHYGITTDDIKSSVKSRRFSYPRQIAMYLCRTLIGSNQQAIADTIGVKNHTTILYGVKKIEDDLAKDKALEETIDVLKKKINPQK